MKPLNRDEPGCNFTSSNCVIWQGPDIPCIALCKGDTVSDVVFKLATELCDVLDTLDVDKYTLTCLNISTCAPKNFHDFLQMIIDTICELQACCAGNPSNPIPPSFNTIILPVAPSFQYINEFGDLVTTMTVPQYVTAIGNRVDTQTNQITVLETTVATHTDQIAVLQTEVAAIPAPNTDLIVPVCVLPAVPTSPTDVVQAVESQFCALLGATGTPAEIFDAIQRQCVGLGTSPTLSGIGGTMNGIAGWNNSLNNMAAAMGNIWLTLCDVRTAITNIQANCCPIGCNGVTMNLTAVFNSPNLTLFVTGVIPPGFTNCVPQGSSVNISDSLGNSTTAFIDLPLYINNPGGYVIGLGGTPVVLTSNLNITITACLTDPSTGTTCQSILNYLVVNQANCPLMSYSPSTTDIIYSGASVAGTNTYTVELWDNTGTILIATQSQLISYPAPINGSFTGLIINSLFRVRVLVTNGTGIVTTCPFVPVSLIPTTLLPVSLGAASSFVVLGAAGINNIGGVFSTFIGDVGSDPVFTIVGITPPDVTGNLYLVPDPAVVNAQVALTNSIADATTRTPMTNIPAALAGTVLTPGYYNITGGIGTINGNVTFDALGDPNAVFIVEGVTSLTTSPASTVTLINGATFNNIFWSVGLLDVGAGSTFKGIVLATGNITVDSSDVQGALLGKGQVDLLTALGACNVYNI